MEPLEAQWGLAVPVAAQAPDIAVDVLRRAFSFHEEDWAAAVAQSRTETERWNVNVISAWIVELGCTHQSNGN